MVKTSVQIDGMACGMCEAHINDTIRRTFDVTKVVSSHRKGQTTILSKQSLNRQCLSDVLGATGYTVLSITVERCERKGLFGRRSL